MDCLTAENVDLGMFSVEDMTLTASRRLMRFTF